MLIVSFDYRDVVHHEFITQDQIVHNEFYLVVLRRPREAVRRKWLYL